MRIDDDVLGDSARHRKREVEIDERRVDHLVVSRVEKKLLRMERGSVEHEVSQVESTYSLGSEFVDSDSERGRTRS